MKVRHSRKWEALNVAKERKGVYERGIRLGSCGCGIVTLSDSEPLGYSR